MKDLERLTTELTALGHAVFDILQGIYGPGAAHQFVLVVQQGEPKETGELILHYLGTKDFTLARRIAQQLIDSKVLHEIEIALAGGRH